MSTACHYVRGDNGERVLIPGCWGSVDRNDTKRCTCWNRPKKRRRHQKLLDDIEEIAVKKQELKIIGMVRELRELLPREYDD